MHPTKRTFGAEFDRGVPSSEALAKEEVLDAEFLVYEGSTSTAGTFVVGGDEAGLAALLVALFSSAKPMVTDGNDWVRNPQGYLMAVCQSGGTDHFRFMR